MSHKTLQLQLLVTAALCNLLAAYTPPDMFIPIGQKPLDKCNFKLLIKYLLAGEQRRRRQLCPICTVCKQAGNWFYQLFTLSTTIQAALGKSIVFHFIWWRKITSKNRAV